MTPYVIPELFVTVDDNIHTSPTGHRNGYSGVTRPTTPSVAPQVLLPLLVCPSADECPDPTASAPLHTHVCTYTRKQRPTRRPRLLLTTPGSRLPPPSPRHCPGCTPVYTRVLSCRSPPSRPVFLTGPVSNTCHLTPVPPVRRLRWSKSWWG